MFNKAYDEELDELLHDSMKLKTVFPRVPKIGYFKHFDFEENDYQNFNIKKSTVQALITVLKEYDKTSIGKISLEKKVHIFLWLLTSDSSYREVGLLFGLSKSAISHIFHEISTLIANLRYNYITWPSVEEQHLTRIKVNSRYKFPNCVGFIDTCRLNVGSKRKMKENLDKVLLQAVCNESLMFIDIYIGPVGQMKKNKVFKESSLAHELKNFVDFEDHILGASEYKLKKNLITPFSSEELLTSEEMKFNEVHWKAYSYIGLAFELLKERFKRLKHIDIVNYEDINTLICSACVMHNFVLLHEGCSEIKEEIIVCDDGVTIDTNIVKTAIEKRQFLCNYINYIHLENLPLNPTPNDLM
ncbi:hypothetical protein ACJJTC_008047 [Scirpophaga incertulas]